MPKHYSAKLLTSGKWTVVDSNGASVLSAPVSEAVARKLASRWHEEPEKRASRPARIFWSDSASTSLMETMQAYDFTIPAKRQADWRAPLDETGARFRGSIPSLSIASAVLLATDGIVAYFVLGDDKTLLYGHLAAFEETKQPREARKEGRKTSPRKSKVQSALDLLSEYFNTNPPEV